MTRKRIVSPPVPSVNGSILDPSVVTGEPTSDALAFDPAQLEAEAPSAPAVRDMFDPTFLGLSQDFVGEAHVKKAWDIIKIEKPSNARVFRVHPDPKFRLKTVLLTLKDDNETYMVLPALRQALAGESTIRVCTLLACVTKHGTPFLWSIPMANADGHWNLWHQSAWQIAEKAQTRWTRMTSNRDAGHYVGEYDQRPLADQQEPVWPELIFAEWLRLAFQGCTIDSISHPVLKRLRLED